MITLFFDGILPFIIISIMNTLIIRAIRQRHREFDTFNTENPGRSSGNNESGQIKRMSSKNLKFSFTNMLKFWVILKICLISGDKTTHENRQLLLTLVLVCSSFLLLATPLYFLLAFYSFFDNKETPERFATFQLIKTIFEQVNIVQILRDSILFFCTRKSTKLLSHLWFHTEWFLSYICTFNCQNFIRNFRI